MRLPLAGAIAVAGLLTLTAPAVATVDSEIDPDCPTPSCEVAVAATRGGNLVLLDPTRTWTERHLDHRPPPADADPALGPPIRAITMGGDGVAYSVVDYATHTSSIWWTSLAETEEEPERVFAGAAPAASPDDRFLAYSFDSFDVTRADGGNSIAVRDVNTGETRFFEPHPDEMDVVVADGSIDAIAWAPDSSRLVYHLSHREGGEAETTHRLYALDLISGSRLSDARYFGAFSSPSWNADFGLVAVEECCNHLSEHDRFPCTWASCPPGQVVRIDLVAGQRTPVPTTAGVVPMTRRRAAGGPPGRLRVRPHRGATVLRRPRPRLGPGSAAPHGFGLRRHRLVTGAPGLIGVAARPVWAATLAAL
jgi:hypothetical protein